MALTMGEEKRISVIEALRHEKIVIKEVGKLLNRSERQIYRFVPAETTWAYMELMREIFLSHGLPLSLYSDRYTIFHAVREPAIVEQLNNIQPFTQFGRAMDELGISIIKAHSPQAKGRIERQWGTLQNRLISELRLAEAKNMEDANRVLNKILPDYNKRFICAPKKQESLFRMTPSQLDQILCLKDARTVNNDHTISFEGLILQIPASNKFHSIAKRRVKVLQKRDGSIEIVYKQQAVAQFSPEAITRLIPKIKNQRTQLKLANTEKGLSHPPASGRCLTLKTSLI